MPSKDSRAVEYAKALRGWAAEHPVADIGLGFVPGVGQLYGLAHAAAANLDPDATALDRGLATAGILPMGRAGGLVKKIVIGEKGATGKELKLLEMARQLLKDKRPPREIDAKTGWWLGGDGQWRMEVPENNFSVEPALKQADAAYTKKFEGPLELGVEGSPLTERYADAQKLTLRVQPSKTGRTDGYFDKDMRLVNSDSDPLMTSNTVAHELQHAGQFFEGRGPNHLGSNVRGTGAKAYNEYLLNPGEIEARVSALRRNWTPEERKALPFREMYAREYDRIYSYLAKDKFAKLNPTDQEYADLLRNTDLDPTDLLLRDAVK